MDEEEAGCAGGLEIDESLSLVERVKFYCQSAVSVQRLVHVQELGACAEEIGAAATLSELVPLLNIVSCDPELGIRQALAEQLVPLARVLLAEPDLAGALEDGQAVTAYQVVIERCVPILSGLLNSRIPPELGLGGSAQLLDSAAEALFALAGLLRPDDVGPTILTPVLCLAHDDEAEVNRVVATQLLGSLAPVVPSELCCQFILPEIISLADDPVFRVRKAAALKIGALCTVVGPELTAQRLLTVYETLCRDDIWGVRKACLESLAEVTAAAPPDAQTGRLVPLLHELYVDTSRWVRVTACQSLGPFLAALPSDSISAELLLFFTQLPIRPTQTPPTRTSRTFAPSTSRRLCRRSAPRGGARWRRPFGSWRPTSSGRCGERCRSRCTSSRASWGRRWPSRSCCPRSTTF
jgi:serine/threonine-protein phosphatase 4 regulatory subunit 1